MTELRWATMERAALAMTRIEYDLLREERPDLKLPDWWTIHPSTKQMLQHPNITAMMLIIHFAEARLLGEIPHGFYR